MALEHKPLTTGLMTPAAARAVGLLHAMTATATASSRSGQRSGD